MLCAKEAAEEAEAEVEEAGYRIKNKNPTQRCGEIFPVRYCKYFFVARASQRICPTTLPASSRRQGLPGEREMTNSWEHH